MATGQVLFVTTGGFYSVSSITDATTVVLTNLGYAGNASSGTVIASGKTVSAGGLIGLTGPTGATGTTGARSEEHTSELQSQSNLVCRLLLDKTTGGAGA